MSQRASTLLSSQDVLAALADDPTERRLSALTSHYTTVLETLPWDLDHVAIIAVPVADGLLILPATHITTGNGWEHFDLEAVTCLAIPVDWTQRTAAFRHAHRRVVAALTEAAIAAEEGPRRG